MHLYGDDWPHWEELHHGITFCTTWLRRCRIGQYGKEKFGTYRMHLSPYSGHWPIHELIKPGYAYYQWPRWIMQVEAWIGEYLIIPLRLYKPIRWVQLRILIPLVMEAARKRFPNVEKELLGEYDNYERNQA